MTKRLLIVTDSLGAPRCDPETVTYEQTWVYALKREYEKRGFDVFSITHNGLHSLDLLGLARTKLNLYNPSVVVIQCGVVDSAPRALKDKEVLLARLLRLQKPVRYLAGKYHAQISKWRNITLFPPEKFNEYISEIYKILKAGDCKIVQIPIAPACDAYVKKSPNIARNIKLFNDILKAHCDVYVGSFENLPADQIETIFMSDHHHLNLDGHALLAQQLIQTLTTAKLL